MNIDKDYSFTVTDENLNEVVCDTLSVVNIEGENPIVIYTDYSLNENQQFNLFVSKVINEDGNLMLDQIDDYSTIPEIQKEIEKISGQINIVE